MIGKSVMSEHLMACGKPRTALSNDSARWAGKSSDRHRRACPGDLDQDGTARLCYGWAS